MIGVDTGLRYEIFKGLNRDEFLVGEFIIIIDDSRSVLVEYGLIVNGFKVRKFHFNNGVVQVC